MKTKTYYINEGRDFHISQSWRDLFEDTGFKFYTPYQGYRKGKYIYLFPASAIAGDEYRFDYDPDIFVH